MKIEDLTKLLEELKVENKRLIGAISIALEDLDDVIDEKAPYDEICCDIKYMFLELIAEYRRSRSREV